MTWECRKLTLRSTPLLYRGVTAFTAWQSRNRTSRAPTARSYSVRGRGARPTSVGVENFRKLTNSSTWVMKAK